MSTKLLLVDDEAGIRKVLGLSLADSGYDVLTAANGDEALRIFRKTRPLIVLTDIKMPGLDGIGLLKKIKQESPDTEVIMITGHGDMDLAIQSLKFEAVDFVTKPINDEVLQIALKRAHERIDSRHRIRRHTENLEQLVREQSVRLVAAERLAAVGQTVEGLSAALRNIAGDLDDGLEYFNEMPCFVAIHNRDMKVVATNQLYRERLGDKVSGRSWEIYGNTEAQRRGCPVARTFESARGQQSKETVVSLDGQRYPVMVHTAPIRNQKGDLELVLEIAADISEIERLREELRATRQKYQQLFDEVPCYITVQDRQFHITASNRRFKEDFGEAMGAFCYQTYRLRDASCERCPVAKTFEDGRSHQSEMVVTARSGQQRNVLVTTAALYNSTGKVEQVMEMSTDISRIRQLQDRLTSLGLMVGSVSHGIKGVLTGLDAGLYLLESGLAGSKPDQVAEGLEVAKLMVERIRNVVLDILNYAKPRPLECKSVEVIKFAEDLVAVAAPRLKRQAIEFVTTFSPALGKFEVDAGALMTALANIFENAVEACRGKGAGAAARIAFSVGQDKGHIIFDIADNGIGMDAATRASIFNLFYSSKGSSGTGLGLFIAQQIVRQHGGLIQVESKLGGGSRFRVLLPRARHPAAKDAAPNTGATIDVS